MTFNRPTLACLVTAASLLMGTAAFAQTAPAPYGAPITIEQAKKVMVAAEAEPSKNNWPVVISIVDSGGHRVVLQRLDAQTASIDISIGRATTAAAFRRPSKALEDGLAAGSASLRILNVRAATALQGGVPIVVDGIIIGGTGVPGVLASQDELVAMAGTAAAAAK